MAWSKAPQSGSFAAITAALMSSSGALAARSSRLLAAAVVLIDDRPAGALGYLPAKAAALFIAFGDMVGCAFLLAGVFGFGAARHVSFH